VPEFGGATITAWLNTGEWGADRGGGTKGLSLEPSVASRSTTGSGIAAMQIS